MRYVVKGMPVKVIDRKGWRKSIILRVNVAALRKRLCE